jgi:hypothetical protein
MFDPAPKFLPLRSPVIDSAANLTVIERRGTPGKIGCVNFATGAQNTGGEFCAPDRFTPTQSTQKACLA